jgi:hypothetical protein
MSTRVLVVSSDVRSFEHWLSPQHGVAAQLDAMGRESSGVVVERIDTPSELFDVANEIKNSVNLPARALVFSDVTDSELDHNPIDTFWANKVLINKPPNYERIHDPIWVWRGDENRPLSPYGRFICSRLIKRALPNVSYVHNDKIYKNWEKKYTDLFHWRYAGMGFDELSPTYEGFLRRVNKCLSASGEDFMALVDARGEERIPMDSRVEGTDIDARWPAGIELPQAIQEASRGRFYGVARQINVVATLLNGDYPEAKSEFTKLSSALPRKSTREVQIESEFINLRSKQGD